MSETKTIEIDFDLEIPAFLLERSHYRNGHYSALPRHTFAEVLYLENGRVLHTVNGQEQIVDQGMLAPIRPDDEHSMVSYDGEVFSLINLAFSSKTLDKLADEYFGGDLQFWGGGTVCPQHFRPDPEQQRFLETFYSLHSKAPRRKVTLHAALLSLISSCFVFGEVSVESIGVPSWFSTGMMRFREPRHFVLGPAELCRLCDRSPEYVARVCRTACGCTPTEVATRLRMEHAGHLLSLGECAIPEVAERCGYSSLTYFYRRFREIYGQTPADYRSTCRALPMMRNRTGE